MKVTIDAAGRVVIPKQVRERLGLTAGSTLEIEELGDHVELPPADRTVWIDGSGDKPVVRTSASIRSALSSSYCRGETSS
ncbi:MAG: AbrB/MazE/SpoVT family DNA-binding domain-containing protein [Pseudonocardia sp.]